MKAVGVVCMKLWTLLVMLVAPMFCPSAMSEIGANARCCPTLGPGGPLRKLRVAAAGPMRLDCKSPEKDTSESRIVNTAKIRPSPHGRSEGGEFANEPAMGTFHGMSACLSLFLGAGDRQTEFRIVHTATL